MLTHCIMVNMETLSMTSKHRNTASHLMYESRCTIFRSGTPEVSYNSMRAGWAS